MPGLRSAIGAAAFAIISADAFAQQGSPRLSSIGYPSVSAALESLKAKSDVKISVQAGWTVIEDGMTLWSFTPPNHPAYPAAVKRALVEKDGAWHVEMNALCQADKAACDKLMAEFRTLNDNMRESIERSHQRHPPPGN
jgi:hypothetical protein